MTHIRVTEHRAGSTAPTPGRRTLRNAIPSWRWASTLLLVLFLAIAWPQRLGGATGYFIVSGPSMEPTYHTLDLALTRHRTGIPIGTPIAYRVPDDEPGAGHTVLHRVVGGDGATGYNTQGDNRDHTDIWHPKDADVLGEVVFVVPQGARYLRLIFSPLGFAVATGLTFTSIAWPRRKPDSSGA